MLCYSFSWITLYKIPEKERIGIKKALGTRGADQNAWSNRECTNATRCRTKLGSAVQSGFTNLRLLLFLLRIRSHNCKQTNVALAKLHHYYYYSINFMFVGKGSDILCSVFYIVSKCKRNSVVVVLLKISLTFSFYVNVMKNRNLILRRSLKEC